MKFDTLKKSILFTRPNYDDATSVLHCFAKIVIDELNKVGEYEIIDLEREKATRAELEQRTKKKSPRLIILNGHGYKYAVCGHMGEEILDENNIDILKSKIAYAVACDSTERLGEISISQGEAEAYIGYDARFMVVTDLTRSAVPSKDKNLKIFFKPYSALILQLVSGSTVKHAVEYTKDLLRSMIREYGVYGIRDKYGSAPMIRFALYWDLLYLNIHGNSSASV